MKLGKIRLLLRSAVLRYQNLLALVSTDSAAYKPDTTISALHRTASPTNGRARGTTLFYLAGRPKIGEDHVIAGTYLRHRRG